MRKLLLGILVICSGAMAAVADVVQLKSDRPESYVVQKGDTLWDISGMFLSDPWLWPDIWHINPQIINPHLIYPGDKLALVQVDGQTKVTVAERGPVKIQDTGGAIKMLPEVRTSPVDLAIPAIPLEKINAFLSKSRLLNSAKELEDAPYVLAGQERRIVSGAGDRMYARGSFNENDKVFGVYRAGDVYVDPETKEVLGMQARDIGTVRIASLDDDVATLIVNRSNEEIRVSDRLLVSEEQTLTSTFIPKAPAEKIRGQIIGVEGAVRNAGNMSVVVINRGKREGLQAGDVLEVAKAGETVRDRVKNQVVQLPDQKAGLLMVFRVFDKMSLGLILQTSVPLSTGDRVRNP